MSSDSRSMTFDGQGLIPAVIQDWFDGTVLMVGYMNQEASRRRWRPNQFIFGAARVRNCGKKVRRQDIFCE